VGFIEDEQYVLAGCVLLPQKLRESDEEVHLVVEPLPYVEGRGYEIKEVERLQEGVGDVRHEGVVVQALQECVDQRGLAGAYVSGEKQEALPGQYAVLQHGQGLFVFLPHPEKPRVRADLERPFPEIVVRTVHIRVQSCLGATKVQMQPIKLRFHGAFSVICAIWRVVLPFHISTCLRVDMFNSENAFPNASLQPRLAKICKKPFNLNFVFDRNGLCVFLDRKRRI